MNRLTPVIAGLLMLPLSSALRAEEKSIPEHGFEARTFDDGQGGKLLYRLLKPANYDPDQEYPLVLFLHGAGERGSDNRRQLIHGVADVSAEAMRLRHPAFVVAPQCPEEGDARWVDVPWGADRHTMPAEPSVPLRQTIQLVAALEQEFSIDDHRLYATGLSMGGYGVWDLVARQPNRWAAVVPICGGADDATARRIAHLPIWVFHGGADRTVPTARSRTMVAALTAAGGLPIYTEYEGVGHNSWSPTYENRLMWDWMFAQRRGNATTQRPLRPVSGALE